MYRLTALTQFEFNSCFCCGIVEQLLESILNVFNNINGIKFVFTHKYLS